MRILDVIGMSLFLVFLFNLVVKNVSAVLYLSLVTVIKKYFF